MRRSGSPIRVLFVDDSEDDYLLVRDMLSLAVASPARYEVDWARSCREAREQLRARAHDAYLVDYRLEDGDGLALVREARAAGCSAPMILVTGHSDPELDLAAMQAGATDYLIKGQYGADLLERTLRYAVERKRLEGMFLQAEKLSAMGQLAAGVAHELNNPLNVILGSALEALESLPARDPAVRSWRAVERASRRCRDLVGSLLTFARKEDVPHRDFPLSQAADAAVDLILPQARLQSVAVERRLDGSLRVRGLANQIEQVLVNLCANALDAMPKGGRLGVVTSRAASGPWAEVRVRDTGPGVPRELAAQLFEPFFTTKPPGKGTGLGLFLAAQVVDRHGGRIELTPGGRGAEFLVRLPLAAAAAPGGGA